MGTRAVLVALNPVFNKQIDRRSHMRVPETVLGGHFCSVQPLRYQYLEYVHVCARSVYVRLYA